MSTAPTGDFGAGFADGLRAEEALTPRDGVVGVLVQGVVLPLGLGFLVLSDPALFPHGDSFGLVLYFGMLATGIGLQVVLRRMRAAGDDAPNTKKYVVKLAALGLLLVLTFIGTASGVEPSLAVGEIALILASLAPYVRQQAFAVWSAVLVLVIYVPYLQDAETGVLSPHPRSPSQAYPDAVRLLVVAGLFAAVGALARRDAAEQAKVASALEAERTRIARELHDIVAHQMTVVVLQAEGARAVLAEDPARAAKALSIIENTTREALVELRRMLGVLREGGSSGEAQTETVDVARSAPQPTLASLPSLFAQMGDGELQIEAEMEVPDDLSPGTELQAYRIVQEALTNVRRHAGAARVDVTIAPFGATLEIRVDDDGAGTSRAAVGGSGLGLQGMRERVELLGGELEAGPRARGGWSVVARLPLEAAEGR